MEPGTPEWRDAQENKFNDLITHPEHWEFKPTEDQTNAIHEAYQRYLELTKVTRGDTDESLPDASTLRMVIANTRFSKPGEAGPEIDVKAMADWFKEFNSDIPELLVAHAGLADLALLWTEKKITHILTVSNLPFRIWDEREVQAHVNSPQNLRRAADALDEAEADGFSLYATDLKSEILTWNLRKGKTVGNVTPIKEVP
jgi:hypothetical protein